MNPKIIDWLTNIAGILLFILEPINSYLTTQPFNWLTFATCVLGAIIAYFTGKSARKLTGE